MTQPSQTCYVGGEPASTSCTSCGRAICAEHTLMGQPFITAGDLARTALRTPAVLFGPPLEAVPYCPECRETLAGQRTTEQLKVLVGLLVLLAVVGGLIYLIAA
jgi:hypothetical protein